MNTHADARPIAVIGAGFSGTMAALHLLPRLGRRAIVLCERGAYFARGVAYGTEDPGHLLNVRAGNMSAFPDDPQHFLAWLAQAADIRPDTVHATPAGTFVSRHVYGDYLTGLLNAVVTQPDGASRLLLVPDEAVDLVPDAAGYRLELAGGMSHAVAGAVLAMGNLLPEGHGPGPYVANPWSTSFTEGLRPGEPVVVVGSGLTMVDIVLRLRHVGFPGPVIAISRHGLRPHAHGPVSAWPTPAFTDAERASPARLLHRVRAEVVAAARQGVAWQSVVDSLRPVTSDLWRGFSRVRQDSFLSHARAWWDIHRHRTAPPIGASVAAMIDAGYLQIRAGHVVGIAVEGGRASVTVRSRATQAVDRITAQKVIQAAGTIAPDRCGIPLVERLLERGLVRLDRHRLGLDQAGDLTLIGRNAEPTPNLWALGPLGTGAFWECVAVPDIRQQAVHVAAEIAGRLNAAA